MFEMFNFKSHGRSFINYTCLTLSVKIIFKPFANMSPVLIFPNTREMLNLYSTYKLFNDNKTTIHKTKLVWKFIQILTNIVT